MKASALGFKHILVSYGMFRYEFECIIGPIKNVPRYIACQHEREPPPLSELNGAYGWTFFAKGCPPIVWIPRFPKTAREYATLTHEVAHAVTEMFGHRGAVIKAECDEPFCHALGYGVEKILEAKRGR